MTQDDEIYKAIFNSNLSFDEKLIECTNHAKKRIFEIIERHEVLLLFQLTGHILTKSNQNYG